MRDVRLVHEEPVAHDAPWAIGKMGPRHAAIEGKLWLTTSTDSKSTTYIVT